MDDSVLQAIRDHAAAEFPRESCGVVVVRHGVERYYPCRNMAADKAEFAMNVEDYARAEDQGEVVLIVHSHPNTSPQPSPADLVMCEATGKPWLIVNWPTGVTYQFEPTGYQAPLVGRAYTHGILDCYSLVRDYFARTLNIQLPDYDRQKEWWLNGEDLYNKHFAENGFEVVDDAVRLHDVFLMQIYSPVVNHAAVYIGDGLILQHCTNLLSSKDVYGGYWRRMTVKRVRHQSQA